MPTMDPQVVWFIKGLNELKLGGHCAYPVGLRGLVQVCLAILH